MLVVNFLLGAIAWCMLIGAVRGVYLLVEGCPDLWMRTANLISTVLFTIATVIFGGMAVVL